MGLFSIGFAIIYITMIILLPENDTNQVDHLRSLNLNLDFKETTNL